MRWIVGCVAVLAVACGSDVGTASDGSGSATSGASACPQEAACREGPVESCGAAVDPICSADAWSCPDGAVEASACDGPLPCADPELQCWAEDSFDCDEADRRSAECNDGVWQCPDGTQDFCGYPPHDHCGDPTFDCVELGPDGCSDVIVPPECDGLDWYCPRGSIEIDACPETTSGTGSSTDTGTSSSGTTDGTGSSTG